MQQKDPLIVLKDILTRANYSADPVFWTLLGQRDLHESVCSLLGITLQHLHPETVLKIEIELDDSHPNRERPVRFWETLPEVLSKFGKLSSFYVHTTSINGSAKFENPLSCWLAHYVLDGYSVHDFDIKIRTSLDVPPIEKPVNTATGLAYGRDRGNLKNIVTPQQLTAGITQIGGRYACKYEIQIRNENEFGVGKRIIGPGGLHMKEIISRSTENQEPDSKQDLKVLLRGLGSNFNCCPQGPGKPALVPESEEPLHITISSKYLEVYTRACQLVESLLIRIYEDLKRFDASGPNLRPKLLNPLPH